MVGTIEGSMEIPRPNAKPQEYDFIPKYNIITAIIFAIIRRYCNSNLEIDNNNNN